MTKVQDVLLKAMAKKNHLVGGGGNHRGDGSDDCGGGGVGWRGMAITGLADRRKGKPSAQRIPLATVEKVLGLPDALEGRGLAAVAGISQSDS